MRRSKLQLNTRYVVVQEEKRASINRFGPCTITCAVYHLTEEGERWLTENYAKLWNEELVEVMGISHTHLHREARRLGLTKPADLKIKERGRKISKSLHKFMKTERGEAWIEDVKRRVRPYGVPNRFGTEAGEKRRAEILADPEKKKALYDKGVESRRQTFETDKARALFGLEQKTRFRYRFTSNERVYKAATYVRRKLRGLGCEISRGGFAVFNHGNVSDRDREMAEKQGFKFR